MLRGVVNLLALFTARGYREATDLGAKSMAVDAGAAYADFREVHGRRSASAAEHAMRLALFKKRRAEIHVFNARPGASWKAGLTQFADYTDQEFEGVLGYRRSGQRVQAQQSPEPSSFLQSQPSTIAVSMDWRSKLNVSSGFQRNQGACGSCWAVAAVGALEMHAEANNGPTKQLSFEQLVDCVPNPQHCGGDGGCKGATAELAFDYVHKHGLVHEDQYKGYMATGKDGDCEPRLRAAAIPAAGSTSASGFVQLAVNKYEPLLTALATKGPVVVSVGAAHWSLYQSGVFDSCDKDVVVNHAVLAVGYGRDSGLKKDYWLIRNSWGAGWGENGAMRLLRHLSDVGDAGHCGTDRRPKEGVFCEDAPKEVPVCGMCGVLSDSSYPTDVRIPN